MAKSKDDNCNVLFQKIDKIKAVRIDRFYEVYIKLNEINLMLEKSIEQLQKCINEKTVVLKKYVLVSQEIDQAIMLLGLLTQEVEHELSLNGENVVVKNLVDNLGLLKEKAWSLLEALDEYCKSEFNYSIW